MYGAYAKRLTYRSLSLEIYATRARARARPIRERERSRGVAALLVELYRSFVSCYGRDRDDRIVLTARRDPTVSKFINVILSFAIVKQLGC